MTFDPTQGWIVAIDPGITGAVALLDLDNNRIDAIRMPVRNNKVDVRKLAEHGSNLRTWFTLADLIICEQVHAMPGQGVRSMFSFGRSTGIILGAAQALCRGPVIEVTPQQWKKTLGLVGRPKEAAREYSVSTFPEMGSFDLKRDLGHHDAACMAIWARDNPGQVQTLIDSEYPDG